jgi:hypothetical protein
MSSRKLLKHGPFYFSLIWGPCWLAGFTDPVESLSIPARNTGLYGQVEDTRWLLRFESEIVGKTHRKFLAHSNFKGNFRSLNYIDPKVSRIVIEFLTLLFIFVLLMLSISCIQRYTEITHDPLTFSVAQGIFSLSTERIARSTLHLKEGDSVFLYSVVLQL